MIGHDNIRSQETGARSQENALYGSGFESSNLLTDSTYFFRSCHEQKGSIPEKPSHPVTSQNINIFLDRYHVDIYTFPKGGMKWGRVER
jgi:hypothetical protein